MTDAPGTIAQRTDEQEEEEEEEARSETEPLSENAPMVAKKRRKRSRPFGVFNKGKKFVPPFLENLDQSNISTFSVTMEQQMFTNADGTTTMRDIALLVEQDGQVANLHKDVSCRQLRTICTKIGVGGANLSKIQTRYRIGQRIQELGRTSKKAKTTTTTTTTTTPATNNTTATDTPAATTTTTPASTTPIAVQPPATATVTALPPASTAMTLPAAPTTAATVPTTAATVHPTMAAAAAAASWPLAATKTALDLSQTPLDLSRLERVQPRFHVRVPTQTQQPSPLQLALRRQTPVTTGTQPPDNPPPPQQQQQQEQPHSNQQQQVILERLSALQLELQALMTEWKDWKHRQQMEEQKRETNNNNKDSYQNHLHQYEVFSRILQQTENPAKRRRIELKLEQLEDHLNLPKEDDDAAADKAAGENGDS